MLRGGAYKPRSSPYSFQGLGREGLAILAEARERTGLPVVTELLDVRDLEDVVAVADVIQVGARNMQNYPLLTEIGRTDRAVLLKRGLAATLDELLMAAEYVLKEGNERVILCERGIRSHETAYRFTLDLLAVPALRERTSLPVFVDPSHAPGRSDWVEPMSLAAAAAGADGIIVEVHDDPENALCDGPQALDTAELRGLRGARPRGRRDRGSRRCRPRLSNDRPVSGQTDSPPRIAVLGVGLIGGSIGLAARHRLGADGRRLGPRAGQRRAARSSSGALDEVAGRDRRAACAGADVVFCAAPVAALPGLVATALAATGPETRRHRRRLDQARARRGAGGGARLRPLHRRPPARRRRDRRRRGTRAQDLFEGARWYLTPTEQLPGRALRPPPRRARRDRRAAAWRSTPRSTTARWRRSATSRTCSPTRSRPSPPARSAARATAGPRSAGASATRPASPAPTRRSGPTSSARTPTPSPPRSTTSSRSSRRPPKLIREGDRDRIAAWQEAAREDRRAMLEADLTAAPLVELRVAVENRPGHGRRDRARTRPGRGQHRGHVAVPGRRSADRGDLALDRRPRRGAPGRRGRRRARPRGRADLRGRS